MIEFALRLPAAALAAAMLAVPAAAAPVAFVTTLSGANESPVNASPATGSVFVSFDIAAHLMRVVVDFDDLSGPNSAAHIHCCTTDPFALNQTASVATTTPTFPGFGLLLDGGHYDRTFDMTLASSYRAQFITGNGGTTASAEQALFNGMLAGKAYFNIHSQQFPGGEIRGFLQVPEPASFTLALGALALMGAMRRKAQT